MLFKGITILAGIEALICISQSTGWITSSSSYFRVTGTWTNPNVTAMFLAMALPVILNLVLSAGAVFRKISIALLLLIIISLLLLECRTALLGALLSSLLVLNYRFGLIKWIKGKGNRTTRFLLLTVCLAIAVPLASHLYQYKKASADGRILIWKLSMAMIGEKPLFGYGYGSFERNYNLFQAQYFKSNLASAKEVEHAEFVRMGYNEFLQNAVEGGLIGLLLFAGVFTLLLASPVRKLQWTVPPKLYIAKETPKKKIAKKIGALPVLESGLFYVTAYAGIAGFAFMSITNFTLQAIPAMVLFIIYSAIIAGYAIKRNDTTSSNLNKVNSFAEAAGLGWVRATVMAGALLTTAAYLAYSEGTRGWSNVQNKKAAILASQGEHAQAIELLAPLAATLQNYESYWQNYGKILMALKNYQAAAEKLENATRLTSDPDLFLKLGYCYAYQGQFANAQQAFLQAKFIAPRRFAPRYALMKLYQHTADRERTLAMANEIVNLIPKVLSTEVDNYKSEAKTIIRQLSVTAAAVGTIKTEFPRNIN